MAPYDVDDDRDLDIHAAAAAERRRADILADIRTATPTGWYMAEGSECPACHHGPRWHDDPDGCTRMIGEWCECERVYLPSAIGPDDVTTE